MDKTYSDYAASKTVELLGIDSPTGFTAKAAEWVKAQFEALGYTASITEKGGVLIELDGENAADALLLEAHTDTLGGMVAEIKSNGRLRLTNLGGLCAANCETENARLYTRGGAVIEGTLQLCNASIHVNGDFADTKRSFDTTELVLDEDVKSAEDTRALGVEVGDFVCFDPRTRITKSGYIKSRFLDDKLSVGILLGLAKYMKDTGAKPERRVYAHITVYEEVGLPKTVQVSSNELIEAFVEPMNSILEAIHTVLERTPPQLVGDLDTNGIIMSGGGSLIYGIDRLIERSTGIRTSVVDDAVSCAAYGAGKMLGHLDDMQDGMMNFFRKRQLKG